MKKEIGSYFWLDRNRQLQEKEMTWDFLTLDMEDIAFLSTGRSAISYVLEHAEKADSRRVALLPPFTCNTVIKPFVQAGYEVYFYRIGKDLRCRKDSFLEDIERHRPTVVLVHSYFGFNTLDTVKEALAEARSRGSFVIEDVTQTMYSDYKRAEVDYIIGSLRKWAELPDGAFAASVHERFRAKPDSEDEDMVEAKRVAYHAKHLYMEQGIGDKPRFLSMMETAKEKLDEQQGIYAMSEISRRVQANLNIEELKSRRRDNFRILLEGLPTSDIVEPVFKSLPAGVTPLYFPLYVKGDRKKLQNFLASKGIYATIIWQQRVPCAGDIDEVSEWIYRHMLVIYCDQRYDADDMERTRNEILNYMVAIEEKCCKKEYEKEQCRKRISIRDSGTVMRRAGKRKNE